MLRRIEGLESHDRSVTHRRPTSQSLLQRAHKMRSSQLSTALSRPRPSEWPPRRKHCSLLAGPQRNVRSHTSTSANPTPKHLHPALPVAGARPDLRPSALCGSRTVDRRGLVLPARAVMSEHGLSRNASSPLSTAMSHPPSLANAKYEKVLDLGNTLRELGVASDLQLPTLVLAGNQSSGKSSVIEAIASVPLPRKADTCTRCPTEVRMR